MMTRMTQPDDTRSVADSRVEMTELVMPQDINPLGSAFGGWVMSLMDRAAAMAAIRHSRGEVTTASVDSIHFRAPMRLGHIVRVSACLTQVFSSSMEVKVDVVSEDPGTGASVTTCTGFLTMVSLGADLSPRPAPRLRLETGEERRIAAEAAARRASRLKQR